MVVRKLIVVMLLLGSSLASAQEYELAAQIRIVKDLLPHSTRLGILYNPARPNIDALISNASQDTGLLMVKSPVRNTRDMTNAVRSLAKYQVDFIFLVEDKTVTGTSSIKFVVKQTMRRKIPVFSTSANAFSGGAFGWVVADGSSWRIKINGNVSSRFEVAIPENSALFTIEE